MFNLLCKVAQAITVRDQYVLSMIDVLKNADNRVWVSSALIKLPEGHVYMSSDEIIHPVGYCAMGLLACKAGLIKTYKDKNINYANILYAYHIDKRTVERSQICPVCQCREDGLHQVIVHMNDNHRLNFTQIGSALEKMDLLSYART